MLPPAALEVTRHNLLQFVATGCRTAGRTPIDTLLRRGRRKFRRIQTLCDFIYLIPLPLGVSAYAKSGNVDVAGYHVRSIAGGMLFGDQWVFFAFVNWTAGTTTDPATVDRFFAAVSDSLSLVKASLSKD